MNKLQLIDVLSNKLNISKKESAAAVETLFGEVTKVLQRGEEINIGGFGAFRVKTRAPRTGINPKTGEKINIAGSRTPAFRPSKALRDAVK